MGAASAKSSLEAGAAGPRVTVSTTFPSAAPTPETRMRYERQLWSGMSSMRASGPVAHANVSPTPVWTASTASKSVPARSTLRRPSPSVRVLNSHQTVCRLSDDGLPGAHDASYSSCPRVAPTVVPVYVPAATSVAS